MTARRKPGKNHGEGREGAPALPGGGLWIAPSHRRALEISGLDSIESLLEVPGKTLHKPGLGGRERLRIRLGSRDESPRFYYLKRYPAPAISHVLRARFERVPPGGSGAAAYPRAWHDVWPVAELAAAGVATYEVAAWGWCAAGPRRGDSAALLAEIPNGLSLERWVIECPPERDPARRKTETALLCRAIASLVRRLHEARLCHRDLYLCHVFLSGRVVPETARSAPVRPDPAATAPRLHLIDLSRVFHPPLRWERWRVKDLAALAASTPSHVAGPRHRLRFLHAYLDTKHLTPAHRRLARRVTRKAASIARGAARRRAYGRRKPHDQRCRTTG